MITDVKKYLIIGTREDLDVFYQRAQEEGFIEFISDTKKRKELPERVQILTKALKIVKKQPPLKPCDGEWSSDEIVTLAEKALELSSSIEKNYEEKRVLEAEIARISPLGDFSLEDIKYIEKAGNYTIQFFCGKAGRVDSLLQKEGVFHVGTFFDLEYFVSVNHDPLVVPGIIEIRVDQSLSELKEQKAKLDDFIHLTEAELKGLAGYMEHFHDVLIEELNEHHLLSAKEEASSPMKGASLFSSEAWIPSTKVSRMFSMLSGLSVHCEQIQIEKDDSLPTVMENEGVGRLGEDLVKIYDLPSVKDKDPSTWVFWFFALFFAMIIADAGYGLLYLGAAAFLKWKMPTLKGAGKRFLKMAIIISVCIVVWGVLTSSYFGIVIRPDSFLGRLAPMQTLVVKKAAYHMEKKDDVYHEFVKDMPNLATVTSPKEFVIEGIETTPIGVKHVVYQEFSDSILLEFSLLLGIFHLSISLCRYGRRNWANFSWVLFLVGGYLFFPAMLKITSMANFLNLIHPPLAEAVGKELLYVGIGGALGLALIQNKLKGLAELTRVIEVFGDVLSYLRLYALALAATILAETFNGMGEAIGLVGGFFVILLGHGVNIALGLMSGVIHGLRLNFIEWYHYSFEGGGRLFNPLILFKSKYDE